MLGTNLCYSLLKDGYFVTGVDKFTENYETKIKRNNSESLKRFKNHKLIDKNLLQIDLVPIVKEADVTFHLAGQLSTHNSWG